MTRRFGAFFLLAICSHSGLGLETVFDGPTAGVYGTSVSEEVLATDDVHSTISVRLAAEGLATSAARPKPRRQQSVLREGDHDTSVSVDVLVARGARSKRSLQPAAEGLATTDVRSEAQRRQRGPSDGDYGTSVSAEVLATDDVQSKESLHSAVERQRRPSEGDHDTSVSVEVRAAGDVLLHGIDSDRAGALPGRPHALIAASMPVRDPVKGSVMINIAESRAYKEEDVRDATRSNSLAFWVSFLLTGIVLLCCLYTPFSDRVAEWFAQRSSSNSSSPYYGNEDVGTECPWLGPTTSMDSTFSHTVMMGDSSAADVTIEGGTGENIEENEEAGLEVAIQLGSKDSIW